MEIREFIEQITEPGGPFSRERLAMIRKALSTAGLIPKRELDPDGAAWLVYSALGMRTSNYYEALIWLQDRTYEKSLNPISHQPVEVLKAILTDREKASSVEAVAVSRPHGVLTVLSTSGKVAVYPQRTIEPATIGGVLGMMGRKGILRAVAALTVKTVVHA